MLIAPKGRDRQAYAHKLLTGRYRNFSTLRQHKGISGYPRVKESKYDCFGTGHSSTSISAALGIATVTGPYMHNFAEITSRLLECSAVVQVSDAMQLATSTEMLLRDANSRKQMGENAMAFVEANRGALAQLQALIDDVLVANTHMNGVHE